MKRVRLIVSFSSSCLSSSPSSSPSSISVFRVPICGRPMKRLFCDCGLSVFSEATEEWEEVWEEAEEEEVREDVRWPSGRVGKDDGGVQNHFFRDFWGLVLLFSIVFWMLTYSNIWFGLSGLASWVLFWVLFFWIFGLLHIVAILSSYFLERLTSWLLDFFWTHQSTLRFGFHGYKVSKPVTQHQMLLLKGSVTGLGLRAHETDW